MSVDLSELTSSAADWSGLRATVAGIGVAGSAAGVWTTEACVASGQAAAAEAVKALTGKKPRAARAPEPGGWAN
ncbi:MAG: hypothetical protein ACO3J3_11990, partial [Candidatus Nanopelagicales bacterium]